jgi:hypothetical protein
MAPIFSEVGASENPGAIQGDEAMRRFMKSDGDSYWDRPDGRQVKNVSQAALPANRDEPHLKASLGRLDGTNALLHCRQEGLFR